MKTNLLKSSLLLLALFAAAAFTSCEKDDNTAEDLKKEITGVWDVTSFKVGGSEYMNTVIEEGSFEYKAFTGAQGEFVQTVKYVDEEPEENIVGTYQVVDGESVKMTAQGETYTLKVKIDGDNIELQGTQDGQPLVVKAAKRD